MLKFLYKYFDFFIDVSLFCMALILLIFTDAYSLGVIMMIVSSIMFFVDIKKLKQTRNI